MGGGGRLVPTTITTGAGGHPGLSTKLCKDSTVQRAAPVPASSRPGTLNRKLSPDEFNRQTSIGSEDVKDLRDTFPSLKPDTYLAFTKMAEAFAQFEAEAARNVEKIARLEEEVQRLEAERAHRAECHVVTPANAITTSINEVQEGSKRSLAVSINITPTAANEQQKASDELLKDDAPLRRSG
ncbi:hypothetical protein QBC46DRAFT_341848 [Diplogelasinospora grovesii]|uniref:Uncharacterized protein n=1 Tax=Diplogelasinospora grovesii TaxID=303347 RepID=A0AAN6NAC3_9PEZI|nr:hypothetical protein QBC46DRAFT_341848 [Diplogelasinospora grovesii]